MLHTKKIGIIAWLVPAILLFLFAVFAFDEWFQLSIVADPKVIAQYPFGAEGPVADDPDYDNLDAYVKSVLTAWVMYSLFATAFVIVGRKGSRKLVGITWLLLVCFVVARYSHVL